MTKPSLDDLRAKKLPQRTTVYLATDSELDKELEDKIADLRREVSVHEVGLERLSPDAAVEGVALLTNQIASLKHEIEDLREQRRANSIKFVFSAMSREEAETLVEEHPPTEEQIAEHVMGGGKVEEVTFNVETYPTALVIQCMTEPDADVEVLNDWLRSDSFNRAEIMTLYLACVAINNERRLIPLGKE